MKRIIRLMCAVSLIVSAGSVFAKKDIDNDYDSNYYQAEGSILFKIRGGGLVTKAKATDLPAPTSNFATGRNVGGLNPTGINTPRTVGNVIANGFHIEGATGVFFGDNIAAELDLALSLYKISRSSLSAVGFNYSNNPTSSKKKNVYAVPLTLLAQYHIAPFGAIRPYVGVGGHYHYFVTKAKEFEISNSYGYALQAGVDFVLRDDTMIAFDVKYYSLQPKIKYKDSFLGQGRGFSTKLKINPLVITAGIGFKF